MTINGTAVLKHLRVKVINNSNDIVSFNITMTMLLACDYWFVFLHYPLSLIGRKIYELMHNKGFKEMTLLEMKSPNKPLKATNQVTVMRLRLSCCILTSSIYRLLAYFREKKKDYSSSS